MSSQIPIDRHYLQTQKVAFQPATEDEALRIQQKLALAGVRWTDSDRVGTCLGSCVEKGMLIKDATLFVNKVGDESLKYLRPVSDILSVPDDDLTLTEEKLYSMIRAQAVEITALHQKIDKLVDALLPQTIDKRAMLHDPTFPLRRK